MKKLIIILAACVLTAHALHLANIDTPWVRIPVIVVVIALIEMIATRPKIG